MTVVDRFVQAVSHGGAMAKPTLIVIHSAETPLQAGYAKSIAENWFGKAATTSAHFMVDPVECIRMLSDNVVSYAVGPKANGFTLNIEQAGYAKFSRAEWTTADGLKQIGKVGALVRELSEAHGIPLRWASDDQIRAAAGGVLGGVCFHNDIARVLGGTTHTDPMPNYPRDLVQQAWSGTPQEDDMYGDAQRNEVMTALTQILGNSLSTNAAVGNLVVAVLDKTSGLVSRTAVLEGQIAGLTAAVSQLQGGEGLDPATVADAAERGAQVALDRLGDALKAA